MQVVTSNRIVALDVLRGFALLGILLMNMQSFAMPGAAYLNPTAYGDLNGANYWVWAISHIVADQKFMSLFSMLFGVGVLVFSQRLEAKGFSSTGLHYRRTLWLLIFGLMHGYLLWYGDILFSYAMCGFWVYLLRNKSPLTLLITAIVLIAISSLINLSTGLAIPHFPPEGTSGMLEAWKPDLSQINKEIAANTGAWLTAFQYRAEETFFMQTYVFLTTFVWRAGGMMLLGMALYKWDFFNANRSNGFYAKLAATSAAIGLVLILTGLKQNQAHGFSLEYSMFIGSQFNYWGSVFVALCYASLVMLAVKHQYFTSFQKRLAAIGQTAFSNYILHTLICSTVFYWLGFFGNFSRIEQLALVVTIWLLQLTIAPIWLKHYRFGPLEWLWRSLTYWELQSMARKS